MMATSASTPTIGSRMNFRRDGLGGSASGSIRRPDWPGCCSIAVAMDVLSEFPGAALRVSEGNAGGLVCGERVDHLGARSVQRDRCGEDIGIAGDAGPEALARLRDFLFGEPDALLSCRDRFARGGEVEERGSHLDGGLLAKVVPPDIDL